MGQGMDGMNESWEPEDIEEPQQRRVNHLLPEPERLRIEADGLFKRAKKAEEKNKALTAERDQLRAEVERLNGQLQRGERCIGKLREIAHGLGWDGVNNSKILEVFLENAMFFATAKAEAAEAHVAGLRRALEGVDELSMVHSPQMSGRVSLRMMHAGMSEALHAVKAALARTPAQSLARIKAEALRDLCDGLLFWVDADVKQMLRMEADRLEKEAANGR